MKKKLEKIFKQERIINNDSYEKFNLRLQNVKKVINHFFQNTSKIVGYGASTKGNIILNHSKLSQKDLKIYL